MKHRLMGRGLGLLLLALTTQGQAGTAEQQLLECMHAGVPSTLRVQSLELVTTDRQGLVRTLKGRLFATRTAAASGSGQVRATLLIDAPDYLAGAAYLVREEADHAQDGMYVYLPSVKRVRHITGGFADGSLLGTNFSYSDFKELATVFGAAPATLEAPGEIDGRPVQVLLFKKTIGPGSPYSEMRAWVDQKTCVPVKADFYEGASLRKQLLGRAGALRQSNDRWYLSEAELSDLKDGGKTLLRVRQQDAPATTPAGLFDAEKFYLVKQ